MTLVLGCDPSAKKIALVVQEDVLNIHRAEAFILYKGTEKQTPESIHRAMQVMTEFLTGIHGLTTGGRFAWVEQPLVGRGGVSTTMKQAYVGGVIRACLVEAGFTVYDAHPSTWRAGLGINSRGTEPTKAATRQVVAATWPKVMPLVDGDSDLTDAAAIAIYGAEQVRKAGVLGATGLAASTVRRTRKRGDVLRPPRVR